MGEQLTFKEIYDLYVDLVFNLGLSYLQNKEDAEEITQDVFLKVYDKIDDFKGEAKLKTWIYRITVNHCLDFIKAKKAKKRSVFFFLKPKEEYLENHSAFVEFNHPGVLLEDKEAVKKLFAQINQLPDKQKTALLLKSVEGLPQKEIGEVMNLSLKAIESLLSRAKANLKKSL